MRKTLAILIFTIGFSSILLGNKDQGVFKIDSLEHKLIGSAGQERMDLLWKVGRYYTYKDTEKAEQYFKELITMTESSENRQVIF